MVRGKQAETGEERRVETIQDTSGRNGKKSITRFEICGLNSCYGYVPGQTSNKGERLSLLPVLLEGIMGNISEALVAERVRRKTNGEQECLSGYSNPVKYARLRVMCVSCGGTWENTYHSLTAQYRGCPICRAKESAEKERKRKAEAELKAERRRQRKELREAEAKQKRVERKIQHPCPVCKTMTTRRKYCSDVCRNKANNSTKEVRRRKKIKDAMVNNDITVMGLFKRDAGVCYLCGGRCNTEDYVMRGEAFIAGDWYPSIDHVVPLAKGGEHSWDNVKLAHRRCNSLKSDRFVAK